MQVALPPATIVRNSSDSLPRLDHAMRAVSRYFQLIVLGLISFSSFAKSAERPPNFVLIFCDDLGYADIGPFGAQGYQTPNLDRMAAEGMKFTDFHSAAAVCSASRAALMTGCYPQRVSILGALGPGAKVGIHEDETF